MQIAHPGATAHHEGKTVAKGCRWKGLLAGSMLDVQGARLRAREHHEGLSELLRFVESLRRALPQGGFAPELEESVLQAITNQEGLSAALEQRSRGLLERFRQVKELSLLSGAASQIQDALTNALRSSVKEFAAVRINEIGIQRTRVTRLAVCGWDTARLQQNMKQVSQLVGSLPVAASDQAVSRAMDAETAYQELIADINQLAARHAEVRKLNDWVRKAILRYQTLTKDAAPIIRLLQRKLAASCRQELPKLQEVNLAINQFGKKATLLGRLCSGSGYGAAGAIIPELKALQAQLDALLDATIGLNERLRKSRRAALTDTYRLLKQINTLLAANPQDAVYSELMALKGSTAAYRKLLLDDTAVMPLPTCLMSLSANLIAAFDRLETAAHSGVAPKPTVTHLTDCQYLAQVLAA